MIFGIIFRLGKVNAAMPLVDIALKEQVLLGTAIASDFIGSHAKNEKTCFFAEQA